MNLTTPKGTGRAVAYQRSSTTLTSYAATSNNNLWYAGSPTANNLIYFDGTNSDQTLTAFQARVTARDNASVSTDITAAFLSTTGSNANFLHLNPAVASVVESAAVNIATFTDDFDGQVRQGNVGYTGGGTAPDIGADEFNGLTCGAVPTLTSIATAGPYYAGDVITVNGTGLAGITIATINGVSATIGALTATTAQLTVPGGISVASGVILVSNSAPCGYSNGLAFTFGGYITKGGGAGTGNWNTATIWRGNAVPLTNSIVVINNGDAVTLDVSADPATLTINATASLTHQTAGLTFGAANLTSTTIAGTLVLDNAATPVFSVANSFKSTSLTVQNGGVFTNNANNASYVVINNFTIDGGGYYTHNAKGSVAAGVANDLPGSTSRSFAATSTVEFQKWANGGTPVALPIVTWGNLIINVASLGASWNNTGNINTINGNFTIQQTGGGANQFQTSTTTNYTLAVGGNISATGGTTTFSSSANYTLTVGGNVTANGGNLTFSTGGGQPTITISGGMTVQGGSTVIGNGSGVTSFSVTNNVLVSGGSFTFGSNTITTNVGGNVTITNGTLTLAGGSGAPTVTIGGNLTVQTGGTLNYGGSGAVSLTVGGDYSITGGTVTTPSNTATINITGTASGSTGSFLMSAGAYTPNTSSNAYNIFTIAGDMILSGGTFDMTGTSGSGSERFAATINGTRPGTTGKLELSGSTIMRGLTSSPITITTAGDFITSGTAQFIATSAVSSGRNQVLNIGGNMNLGSGTTFSMPNTNSTASVIRFIGGNLATAQFTNNAASFTATGVDTFVVETGKTLIMNSDWSYLTSTSPFFVVRGTLDLCSDKIISGAGTFTLAANATLKIGNQQGITAAVATATGSVRTTVARAFPATANYEYCGSVAQVTGTGLTGAAKLTINNAAGVTFNNSSIAVSDSLIFKAGILTLGTYNVSLPGPGRISGANSSRFVQTNSSGHLAITIPTTGLPVTVNYPVGSNGQYMPASYTFTANSTARDLQVRAVTPRNINDLSPTDYINNRWWNTSLSNSTGSYTYTASYTYISGDVVGIAANIHLNKWNGTTWIDDPGSSVNTGTLTLNSGTLTESTGSLAATAEWVGRAYRAPAIFTWTNPVNGSWLDASKWTPTGVPGSGDGVIFDKAGSYNVFQMPVGISLTQMHNTGSTLILRASGAGTVNILPASAAPQFRISAGASTTLDSLNAVNLNLVSSATGTVSGSLNLQRTTHTATAVSAGAMVFPSGGYFSYGSTSNTGYSGNPFGSTGTNGSVIFQNGSVCESFEGSNPFGAAATDALVTFQGGSLFRYSDPNPVASPSLAGRTYANFEYNANKTFSSLNFNTAFVCDTLTVSLGSMAINASGTPGHAIRGNINVKTGATLGIAVVNPGAAGTVNMNSGATQTIYGGGTFTVTGTYASQTLNINAGTTVSLQKNMTVANGTGTGIVAINGTLICTGENYIDGAGSVNVNNGGTLSIQSVNGINNTGTSGNIRSTGYNYFAGGNYTYSGSDNQVTGNRLPATLTAPSVLTIANTGTAPNNVVTLSVNNTTTPRLNLNAGQFNAGTNGTLIINGGTNIVSGGGGNQYLAGGANDNIIRFASNGAVQGTPELYNITIGTSGGGVDFTNNARINGILLINNLGSVNPNAPRYAVGSTLIYNAGGAYIRNVEWGTNTALAPSYPHHVIIQNGTTLSFTGTTTFDVGCGGNLSIGNPFATGSNGTLDLSAMSTYDLYVNGNINIGGTGTSTGAFTMSNTIGGDLYLVGNWTRNANGTVNFGAGDGRAVFFTGATDATITANGGQVFPFAYINKSTPATKVTLADHVSITDEISFTQGTVDLGTNNKFLTLISTAAKTARVGQSSAGNTSFVYGASGTTGQFIMQRYFPARRAWRLVAAPIHPSGGTHTIAEAWQEQGNGANGRDYTSAAWSASVAADTITAAYGTHITGGTLANGFDLSPTNSSGIKYYNAGSWPTPPNTNATSVNSQEGWMLFVRGDRKTYGEITNQYKTPTITTLRPRGEIFIGNKTVTAPAGGGLKVVGNPYASAVDYFTMTRSGAGWPANPTYYVWDPYLGGAQGVGAFVALTWNGTNFTRSAPLSGTGTSTYDNRYIPSGAAIMVDFPNGSSLQIKESDKATANTTNAFRPTPLVRQQQMRTVLYGVDASDNSTYVIDGILSLYDHRHNNAVDENDARKLGNFNENILIEKDPKTLLVIERRKVPANGDTIYFGIYRMQRKQYQVQFELEDVSFAPNTSAYLEDLYLKTKTTINLSGTTTYNFSITEDAGSAMTNRFRMVFRRGARFAGIAATQAGSTVTVNWQVADGQDMSRYEVERSADNGNSFTAVGKAINATAAIKGIATESSDYSAVDEVAAAGEYQYRIKGTGKDGAVLYSDVVKVQVGKGIAGMQVYPNPVRGNTIRVKLEEQAAGRYRSRLLAADGTVISSGILQHPGGSSVQEVRSSQPLAAGTYRLELTSPAGTSTTLQVVVVQ
jgi:hypothetical protein